MATKKGPNPRTVADGYSLSDEREPVTGPELDFNYDDDNVTGGDDTPGPSGIEHHLPNPNKPKLHQSHVGEHRGDYGGAKITITRATYVYVLCASLNSCNLGYDIGVSTNAGPLVQEYFDLTDIEIEIFLGGLNLFAMFGAIFAQTFSDKYGRRNAFIVAAVNIIIGCGVLVVASNYAVLIVGRVFVGLGVGFGLALDPIYIAEVSPAAHRGELVTWAEIALNAGIVLGFLTGLFFSGIPDSTEWRYMFAMGAVMPIIMIFLANSVMAESPRWLMSKKQPEKAAQVLQKIYGDGYDIKPVMLDMKESLERDHSAGQSGWDMIIFPSPAYRRMLLVGLGTAISQQAVGIDAIQYFLIYIIEEAGIESRGSQAGVLVFLGVIKLVFIIVGGKLFDRKGRRPLFFVSLAGMAAALLMLSINFFSGSTSSVFSIVCLGTYLAMFSVGMGPGAWLIPSEIFATSIRAKAMSVATFANRATATLMSSTFLTTAHAMSWAGFFFLLSIVCLVVLAFLYFYLPETKERSLEDMSVYFAEITGDRTILEVEERITREREAREHAAATAPRFEPPKTRELPREPLPDAKVSGTMA